MDPITAARARAGINGFYVWAMEMGYVEAKPGDWHHSTQRIRGARRHVLSDAELAAVWRAAGDDDHGKIIKLLILTAAAGRKLGSMRWSELDNRARCMGHPRRARQKPARTHSAAPTGRLGDHRRRTAGGRPRLSFRRARRWLCLMGRREEGAGHEAR